MKTRWLGMVALLASIVMVSNAHAVNVLSMSYESNTDELLLKVAYRGTHDKHTFSLAWDECHDYAFAGAKYQLMANLVDSEPNDKAEREFTQDLRFSLAGIECRPAKVTIRTAPGFNRTIVVPALDN
jgi:hypothetical protein